MHPSSRRVGPTKARSSASSRVSCPGLGRKSTTSVTAFFGSLAEAVGRGLRLVARFFRLGLGIVAGLYSKTQPSEEQDSAGLSVGDPGE